MNKTFDIGEKRKLTVKPYNNRMYIDIREFFVAKDKCIPTKTGLTMTIDDWNVIMEKAPHIDDGIRHLRN